MVKMINGRLMFVYSCPQKQKRRPTKANYGLSLLVILLGIFLLPHPAYLSSITPEKLIDLTNQERQNYGLNTLTASPLLTKAALFKGQEIFKSNIFGHTINDKKFSGWIKESGYNYSYAGENLAIDFISAEGVVEAWNNSPAHKKNLLSPYYSEIGVAALEGKFKGQNTMLVIQEFGAPAAASAEPLTLESDLRYGNSVPMEPKLNFFNSPAGQAENLLTNSVSSRQLVALAGDKIALPSAASEMRPLNKFIAQSNFGDASNGFILIFAFITLIYFLLFLYYYYFLKINRLVST